MTNEARLLIEIGKKLETFWDEKYGAETTQAFAMHYGLHGAANIFLNAKGREIDINIVGSRMPYKFEDEPDEMFRGSIEEISIEELESILQKST
jgi:hypothetical protein